MLDGSQLTLFTSKYELSYNFGVIYICPMANTDGCFSGFDVNPCKSGPAYERSERAS